MIISIWRIEEITGYKPITMFWLDFYVCDQDGPEIVRSFYNKIPKENLRYDFAEKNLQDQELS